MKKKDNYEYHHLIESKCVELKKLKQKEKQNSTYCLGVVQSLKTELKKILKVYNNWYSCSEGLGDLQKQMDDIDRKLGQLKKKYKDIEYDSKSDQLKRYFKDQQGYRNHLIS